VRTAKIVFLSSATFSTLIAVVYWYLSREPAGTMLLGFMAAALAFVAVFMQFTEGEAKLFGDMGDATMQDAAGEQVGTYITHSPAPFWIAVALAAMAIGLVIAPAAVALGAVAIFGLIVYMIVRSR
jgi:hypothetical protein